MRPSRSTISVNGIEYPDGLALGPTPARPAARPAHAPPARAPRPRHRHVPIVPAPQTTNFSRSIATESARNPWAIR